VAPFQAEEPHPPVARYAPPCTSRLPPCAGADDKPLHGAPAAARDAYAPRLPLPPCRPRGAVGYGALACLGRVTLPHPPLQRLRVDFP